MDRITPQGIVLTIKIQKTIQNFDELAEGYLGLVEKQKESEGKAVDMLSEDWVLVDPNE